MRKNHRTLLAWAVVVPVWLGAPAVRGDEFDDLQAEFEAAQNAWFEKVQALEEASGGKFDMSKLPPSPAKEFLPKFRAYAEKHADTLQGMRAMMFIIQTAGMAETTPWKPNEHASWAIDTLEKRHAANPEIKEILGEHGAGFSLGKDRLARFFEAVVAANKDKDALAKATFALGATLYEPMEMFELGSGTSKSAVARREAEKKRAAELFRKVITDFPDSDVVTHAKGYIFEIERLQPGMKAPDIVGRDENDKEIRLSQFKGQVVMLDFWGFW